MKSRSPFQKSRSLTPGKQLRGFLQLRPRLAGTPRAPGALPGDGNALGTEPGLRGMAAIRAAPGEIWLLRLGKEERGALGFVSVCLAWISSISVLFFFFFF